MDIKLIDKDQIRQADQTTYWFNVGGETWGIADQAGQGLKLLDIDGYPKSRG